MSNPDTGSSGALAYIFSRRVVRKSLILAAIVGSALSIVNQADVLLRDGLTVRTAIKLFLNFLIPFIVASVSAALNRPNR